MAVVRNDEAGWLAVPKYFPEPNATNRAYHAKSMLQLSQLLVDAGKFKEADVVLEKLHRNENVDRLFQAVALARRCQVLEKLGGGNPLTELRQQLKTLYAGLQNDNSEVAEVFDDIIREDQRLQLGIGSTGGGT
jgi:hypothetical protein